MSSKEPRRLSKGKEFHLWLQENWHKTAQGKVETERPVTKPSGRRGRIDIIVDADQETKAVIEAKHSDWDAMAEKNVKRNVRRQAKQLWDYILSQPNEGAGVSPGIIFARKPTDRKRLKLVESLFDAEDVPIYWQEDLEK